MCLAQGHNSVTQVRLEPVALRSRVKHSTTEPQRSLYHTSHLYLWYEGHPIKNETFAIAQLINMLDLCNLDSKLARLFGCSHVPYSTCYIVPIWANTRGHLIICDHHGNRLICIVIFLLIFV